MRMRHGLAAGLMMAMAGVQAADAPRWQQVLREADFAQRWQAVGNAPWRWDQGALLADGGDGFVVSRARHGDFELRVEVLIEPQTNSGVFIRCADPQDVSPTTCYEVNLWDDRDGAYATGSIVQLAEPATRLRASGQWSTLYIRAQGKQLLVRLNDVPAVQLDNAAHAEGHIALQFRGSGSVRFRRVDLRPL